MANGKSLIETGDVDNFYNENRESLGYFSKMWKKAKNTYRDLDVDLDWDLDREIEGDWRRYRERERDGDLDLNQSIA